MAFLTKEDYLKLIESAQTDEDEMGDDYPNIPESAWIPAESPAKAHMESIRAASAHGMIDVLKYKKEQIREALYRCINLQVGEFTIHVEEYHGRPLKKIPLKAQLASGNIVPSSELTMNILVYQERTKTMSGAPCKMSFKMNFFQDNRFTGRPWLTYFNNNGYAHNVPVDTVVEMVRWFQALKRMNAFL